MEAEGEKVKDLPSDFSEGLSRILSAIHANVNANIISPTLSHFIATVGSRFLFSHETSPLLLAQMEDYLHGKILVLHLEQQRVISPNFGQIHMSTILCLDQIHWRILDIMNLFPNTPLKTFLQNQFYTQISKKLPRI